MIVEFIGCSGAGKTTLMRAVLDAAPAAARCVSAWDLVRDRPGRRWISGQTGMNLLADATAAIPFARALRRNQGFVKAVLPRMLAHAPSTFAKLNYTRNVIRKVGMHELGADESRAQTVLADEGTLLIAYQLFVYSHMLYTAGDIEEFVKYVPAPDRVVYVKAPMEDLVQRALHRPDPRRELAGQDPSEVRSWLERADGVFDTLTSTERIRARTLVVQNADRAPGARQAITENILRFIQAPDDRAHGAAQPTDCQGA